MTEATSEALAEAVARTWENQPSIHNCYGFIASGGNLKLSLGYAVYATGQVLLYCYEKIGSQSPQLWRRFYTSKESALEEAEDLCADVDEYLDSYCNIRRPAEDFSIDDFLMHLETRLKNEFN